MRIEIGQHLLALDLPYATATAVLQCSATTGDHRQETRGPMSVKKRESERGTGTAVGRGTTTGMLTEIVGLTTTGTGTIDGWMTALAHWMTAGLPMELATTPAILPADTTRRHLKALGLVVATNAVLIHGRLPGTSVKNVLLCAHR